MPEPTPVAHACPPKGSGVMPCCGRTPFEVPRTDRISVDPFEVTCGQPAPAHSCDNCDGIDPDSCLFNPDRPTSAPAPDGELERLRTENERMRHELEVMYGGAFDTATPAPPPADVRECAASISGNCLAEGEGYTGCATEDGECIHAPAPAPVDVRDQIAAALYEWSCQPHLWADAHPDDRLAYGADADAVLRVPAIAEALAARAAVARVRELHTPVDCGEFTCDCHTCCRVCRWTQSQEEGREPRWGEPDHHVYPCPTIRALEPS
ncbi:hypothetical protein [Streptomyces sp. NPDC059176]|uniref:hypothetical protein n=1 Tax=Streptomyces sp. NPDC059176 TaxID=3346758 RepID=UPI0036BC4610